MRIALPLSVAALLFTGPVLAPSGVLPAALTASAAAAQTQSQAHARTTQAAGAPSRTASAHPSQANPAPAKPGQARPGQAKPGQARAGGGATRTASTHSGAARPVTGRPVRVVHGLRAHNYARGVESAHPGLGPEENTAGTDDAAPQLVHFPGAVAGALPNVVNGGPSGGAWGDYCGHMLMPAVALREVSRGFSRGHSGIDLMAPHGSPIHAAAAGTVIYAGWYFAYGNIVDIRHADGVVTRYAHMSAFAPGISAGAPVAAGEEIGKVGATGRATGPHVHFEVRLSGRAVDPRPYLALASCDGTGGDEILEAYADDHTTARHRPAVRTRQAAAHPQARRTARQ